MEYTNRMMTTAPTPRDGQPTGARCACGGTVRYASTLQTKFGSECDVDYCDKCLKTARAAKVQIEKKVTQEEDKQVKEPAKS